MAKFELICEQCLSPFTLISSPAIAKRRKFCSRGCVAESFRSRQLPLLESLRDRLLKRGELNEFSGCIIYTGQNNGRYGQIEYKRKTYLAHRAAYIVFVGPIKEGMFVCHSCDNRLCINPRHLWVGTHEQNMADMFIKDRDKYNNSPKKVTDDIKKEILNCIYIGEPQSSIAKKYNISQAYVSMIGSGLRRSVKAIKP